MYFGDVQDTRPQKDTGDKHYSVLDWYDSKFGKRLTYAFGALFVM